MNSRLEIKEMSNNTQKMLCPCCGGPVLRRSAECSCGARFVGEPLDEIPIQVQRLGPAMISVALLAVVVTASIVATKWLAFAAILVIWSARRAMRLAKQDREWYGGYKTAAVTLSVTLVASAVLAAYGIAHIPQALESYQLRQIAATQAMMYHIAGQLEAYKRSVPTDSYPSNTLELRKAIGGSLPADYWDRGINYHGYPGAIADRSKENTVFQVPDFELRSAGPDGILGTDDDVVMRDGILLSNSQAKNQPVQQLLR